MSMRERFDQFVAQGNVMKAYSVGSAAIDKWVLRSQASCHAGHKSGKARQVKSERLHTEIMGEAKDLFYEGYDRSEIVGELCRRGLASESTIRRALAELWGPACEDDEHNRNDRPSETTAQKIFEDHLKARGSA